MFENVTRSLLHAWFTLFGNSQGVVEGQTFNHATQNGAWTTNSFTPQSNTPIMKASELLVHKVIAHLRKKLLEILTLRVFIVVRALFYHNRMEIECGSKESWTEPNGHNCNWPRFWLIVTPQSCRFEWNLLSAQVCTQNSKVSVMSKE